jgi:hypothetical protein
MKFTLGTNVFFSVQKLDVTDYFDKFGCGQACRVAKLFSQYICTLYIFALYFGAWFSGTISTWDHMGREIESSQGYRQRWYH